MGENKKPWASIELEYESLIALIQGKQIHLKTPDFCVIIQPPFKGVLLTMEEVQKIKFEGMAELLRLVNEKGVHIQNVN